ncbi:phage tail tip fiber protein [Pseudomonas iridis]
MSGGVKKLASVVIGAVVGFAQGGPWGAVAGAALAFYAAEQQEKLNTKSPLRDNEPSAQTVRSSKAPVRYILGRVSTGGVLVWAQEQAGDQGEGEWLHLVYVLCEGAIDALENIYLGEEEIGSFGPFATYELVVEPTQVNAFLKANCPDWKDSQIGRGLSFVRISLFYSAEKFPSGIPDTRFVVRGRNDIYDPRSNTAGYSANTALHLLWYLRARCGVPDDEIVFETFASAANVCDEAVTNADGSTSQRYRSGCVIGADEQRTGVLQKLEAAAGGHLIRVGGRWMFQAGAYYGPYDFEITEDMVIGTVTGSTEPTNDSAINTVRGTFIDPSQSWTETDYPEVSVAEWIVEDGGEAAETLTYSYVTDPYQAQRLANMELRRRRAGGAISIPMNFAGYNCRPGRVVRVNLPSLNILGEFIVSDWSMGDREGCTVQVKQYEPAIFDDAVGQPYNPIGFINLPSGGLGSPTNLTWTQDTTAEVIQGVLSWLPPSGIVKEYIVIVRQGTTAIQSHNVPSTSTECAINGLPSGNYTMSVAAVGPMARSGEVTISISINGPPIPESCVVQSSIDNIVLIPGNAQNGLNGGTYEYFFSTSPTATSADAEYLGQGLSFTHTGLGFWTNYYYFIRSSNAYGKSSFLYVPAQTSNDVSAYLAALAGKITKTELRQELADEIDKIPGLQAQIDALDGLKGYDPEATYEEYDLVVQGKRIYQATGPVPLNMPPPNPLYWLDVGQTVETANGLAQQVATNTADITEIDGVVTAQATAFEALRASYRDDDGAGDLADAIKSHTSTAALASESKVRASENEAMARRVTTFDAKIGENAANITELEEVVVTNQQATAQQLTQLSTTVGSQQTAIQQNTSIINDVNGKVTASWSVKMQYNSGTGQYIAAGIGLGIENGPAGLQSQFLVSADRFAIVNTIAGGAIAVPFAVQGGQVFMNAAFIMDGSITNAKIGNYISSSNYIAGQQGWILNKDGTLEINGIVPGQGRLVINSLNVSVYDANNVLRVRLGYLG